MKILIAGDYCQRYRVDTLVKDKCFGELFDQVKPIIESADILLAKAGGETEKQVYRFRTNS